MLVVETIAKVRRAHRVQGKPIKEICREFGLSRKVVRKIVRSEAIEFLYERSAKLQPRIGPWKVQLEGLLQGNEACSANAFASRAWISARKNASSCGACF